MGSDDDAMSGVTMKTKTSKAGKSKAKEQFIRANDSDDEPLDLLDPKSVSAVSSRRSTAKLEKKKTKARVNEDGKLVLGAGDVDDDDGDDASRYVGGDMRVNPHPSCQKNIIL